MSLRTGDRVWLPCEVKPGPFSNERLVRVKLPTGEWIGFVDTQALKDEKETGPTHVLAVLTSVEDDRATAAVQGHAFDSRYVQASTSEVQPFVPLSS